jgi:hypothetical protein
MVSSKQIQRKKHKANIGAASIKNFVERLGGQSMI